MLRGMESALVPAVLDSASLPAHYHRGIVLAVESPMRLSHPEIVTLLRRRPVDAHHTHLLGETLLARASPHLQPEWRPQALSAIARNPVFLLNRLHFCHPYQQC